MSQVMFSCPILGFDWRFKLQNPTWVPLSHQEALGEANSLVYLASLTWGLPGKSLLVSPFLTWYTAGTLAGMRIRRRISFWVCPYCEIDHGKIFICTFCLEPGLLTVFLSSLFVLAEIASVFTWMVLACLRCLGSEPSINYRSFLPFFFPFLSPFLFLHPFPSFPLPYLDSFFVLPLLLSCSPLPSFECWEPNLGPCKCSTQPSIPYFLRKQPRFSWGPRCPRSYTRQCGPISCLSNAQRYGNVATVKHITPGNAISGKYTCETHDWLIFLMEVDLMLKDFLNYFLQYLILVYFITNRIIETCLYGMYQFSEHICLYLSWPARLICETNSAGVIAPFYRCWWAKWPICRHLEGR